MKKYILAVTFTLSAIFSTSGISFPSVFPTGTTIFQPEKTWQRSRHRIVNLQQSAGHLLASSSNSLVVRNGTQNPLTDEDASIRHIPELVGLN